MKKTAIVFAAIFVLCTVLGAFSAAADGKQEAEELAARQIVVDSSVYPEATEVEGGYEIFGVVAQEVEYPDSSIIEEFNSKKIDFLPILLTFADPLDDGAFASLKDAIKVYPGVLSVERNFVLYPAEDEYLVGDVSRNGIIEAGDYAMVKRYILGNFDLDIMQEKLADVNDNGEVDANDYAVLKRSILGNYELEVRYVSVKDLGGDK